MTADQRAAYNVVRRTRRAGLLESQPCRVCDSDAVAHHEDYTRPLDITWLCRKHHAWRHLGYSIEQMKAMRGWG